MSYIDFSFAEVLERFDLKTQENMGAFADIPEVEPSDLLKQAIKRYFPLLRASFSMFFPILLKLK